MLLKFWKEILLPFFGIFLNVAFGFLFFLFLKVIYLLQFEGESSDQIYPELGLVSLGFLLLGFVLGSYTKIRKQFRFLTFLFYLSGLVYAYFTLHRPFIAESLFYRNELLLILGLIFLTAGYHASILQDSSKAGFLIGIFGYSFLNFLIPLKLENYKSYFILFLSAGIISGLLEYLPVASGQFLPRRPLRKNFKFFEILYSCFWVVFLIHTGITFLRGFEFLFVAIFLFLLSYLSAKIFVIYFLNETHFKISVIYGRNLLVLSFVLMSVSFSFPVVGLLVFFLAGGGLGFFRPRTTSIKNIGMIFLLVFVSAGILIPIVKLSRQNYYWIHLLIFLTFVVFYPFLRSRIFHPPAKHIPVLISVFISMFFFKPFVINIPEPVSQKTELNCEPIPYLLSDFIHSKKRLIHIQSCLPYDSEIPHPETLHGSIPVLGSRKTHLIEYYRDYMRKEFIPHYTIQPGTSINVSLQSYMQYQSFPGFVLYYSHEDLKPAWNQKFSMDWKFFYILDRLKEEPDFTRHPAILRKLELYAGYEIQKQVENYKNIVQKSIRNYCEHFLKNFLYSEALNCYVLELEYGDLPEISLQNSYKLLNYTTPSISHIQLLERLARVEEYKTSVNKKIYPIYMSVNMQNEAARVLENLMELSEREGATEQRNTFELEWVRALLESDKLEKAYPAIQSALRRNPDSILWKRILADYESKREARRRIWSPPQPSMD